MLSFNCEIEGFFDWYKWNAKIIENTYYSFQLESM